MSWCPRCPGGFRSGPMWNQKTRGGFDGTMPFGKHKGARLEDVPDDYLRWLLRNCDLGPIIRKAIEAELGIEGGADDEPRQAWTPPPGPPANNLRATLDAEVQRLRRKYAATTHPDRGGSSEAMQAINAFADDVLKAIAGAIR